MAQAMRNLGEIWQRASLVHRVVLVATALACVGAAVLLVNWARQPDMALLYSGLEAEEAARIVEKAREANVAYELRAGGTAVYVPTEQVHSLRLTMAAAGLPSGGNVGYGVLDDGAIGDSPFMQNIKFKRAVEGELAKSIELIDGVARAKVHLVQPKQQVLTRSSDDVSATVVVRLKPGMRLSRSNVAAITVLVSKGGGVPTRNIGVIDSSGNLLSGDGTDELAKQAGNALDAKAGTEQYLTEKATRMLSSLLGPGRASVEVSAKLNMDQTERVTKILKTEERAARSEKIRSTSSIGGATGAGAAPSSTDKTEEITTEYEWPETRETQVIHPGTIESLSVAVCVDLRAEESEAPAEGAGPKQAVAAAGMPTVQDVEDLVKSCLGLTDKDTLTVKNAPMARTVTSTELTDLPEGGWMSQDFLLDMARRSSLGVLVVGALIALRMFRGPKPKAAKATAGAEMPALAGAEGATAALQGGASTRLLPGMEGGLADADALRERISAALQENPDEVKRLFLSWVESEKGEA